MTLDIQNKILCSNCEDYFEKINPMGYLYLVPVDSKGFGGRGLNFCTESCLKEYVEENFK